MKRRSNSSEVIRFYSEIDSVRRLNNPHPSRSCKKCLVDRNPWAGCQRRWFFGALDDDEKALVQHGQEVMFHVVEITGIMEAMGDRFGSAIR